MTDAIVIGAGISGAAAAFELARSGLRVVLLDRYSPAAMASGWTLAGVRQSSRHPAELALARAAIALRRDLDETLDAPTFYCRRGNLRLARSEAEARVIEHLVAEQSAAGLDIVLLRDHREIQAIAPAIAPGAAHLASFCASRHPYTRLLRDAAPVPDPRQRITSPRLIGEIPSAAAPPPGCHFHPRCPRATEICRVGAPIWSERHGHGTACHHPLAEPN